MMKKLIFAVAVFAFGMALAMDYAYTVAEEDLCQADNIFPTTAADKTAFTDINLSEWRVAGGFLAGANIGDLEAIACKESGTDSDRTVWLQSQDGVYVKGVKIRLWQDGSVVKVRAVDKAHYADGNRASGSGYCEAVDLDNDYMGTYAVAGSATAGGYGIKKLTLMRKTAAQRVTTAFTDGDTVTLGDYADVTISAPDALASAMPVFTVPRRTRLTIENLPACDVGDVFRGAGEVVFANPETTGKTDDRVYDSWYVLKWPVVATNAYLQDVMAVTADSMYRNNVVSSDVRPYFFSNDGMTARVQLQAVVDGWLRCICVDLRQGANGVEACIDTSTGKAMMYPPKQSIGFGYDFDTEEAGGSYGIQQPGSGGGINNLRLTIRHREGLRLTADLRYSNATNLTLTAGSNATVVVTGIDVPPAKCVLAAQDGGAMFLDTPGVNFYGLSDGRGHFDVRCGGELRFCRANQSRWYADQRFRVSGGEVFMDAHDLATKDSGNYINELILEDGAVLSGARPRVGYTISPTWRIRGTSASTIQKGFVLAPTAGKVLTLNVQDVTGNDAEDLVIHGTISDYSSDVCCALTKTGAGTVLVDCAWSQKAAFSLTEGTWKLARNATTTGKVNVSLDGGCLAAVTSTTNAFAALALTKSSQIVVADGAELTFADTSAVTWADGVRLNVTCDTATSCVRFGSSSSGLTATQLKRIRFNGTRAKLLDDGSLASDASGLMFILR